MERQSTIRVIVHGKVAARPEIRRTVQVLRRFGYTLEFRATRKAGGASAFLVGAVTRHTDTVVAGRGDATIDEVPAVLRRVMSEGIAAQESLIVNVHLPCIELDAPPPAQVNLHDELIPASSFRFGALRRAIPIHLPERSPILAG